MYDMVINIISRFGYIGILLLIAIENIFPPIPSEVILTFSGFVAKDANLSIILIIIFATIGSLLGAIILYLLGYILNTTFFSKVVDTKLGHILHLDKEDINRSIEVFKRKGYRSVFFGRLIPIVRSLISIPAGMMKMDMKVFLILTTLGSLLWNTILIIIGMIVGKNYLLVANFISKYYKLLLVILIMFYILIKVFKRNRIKVIKRF